MIQEETKSLDYLGYPNYTIDTKGNVYSSFTNKKLKENKASKYRQVTLYNQDGHKTFLVHRLVATTFLPNPNKYDTVDHIDYDVNNNSVDNLRWLPKAENSKRSWDDENHNGQKKNVTQFDTNGEYLRDYDSIQEAANAVCCDRSNISRACSIGRTCSGYKWQYK